ncbi:hypothetical protein BDV93DRAFT_562953 [Ceratobasidium sp. AG-I]|nr:hypothetical protein BDV93DRAFT_562953 [Ceratobasidium sp. AG-I]
MLTVMHKFDIEHRVWWIVSDNTSNNVAMMNRFASLDLKCLTGPKAVAKPFRNKHTQLDGAQAAEESNQYEEDWGISELTINNNDINKHHNGTAALWTLVGDSNNAAKDNNHTNIVLIMHLSMHIQYLKATEWENRWIESASKLAETCWHKHYKPEEVADNTLETPCPFGYSSFLDKMYLTMGAVSSLVTFPVRHFIHGNPIIEHDNNGKPKLLDLLVW